MRLAPAGRVAAVLLGGVLAGAPAWGAGGQRFGPGTVELALKGGCSIDHPQSRATAADGVHVVPHVGFFLRGERGPGWTRGNVELLVEPTLIHFDVVDSTTIGGVAILARWVFSGWPAARP